MGLTRRRLVQLAALGIPVGGVMSSTGSLVAQEPFATPAATPVALDRQGNETLLSMLALAPDVMSTESPPAGVIASYADVALRMQMLGVAFPSTIDDEEGFTDWIAATRALAIPGPFVQFALVPEFRDLLGWDITELEQALEVGDPPNIVIMLRGRFDQGALEAAWASQGYDVVDVEGQQVASRSEEADIDFNDELNRRFLARANNAALLPDGTLVYTPTLELMRAVVLAQQGQRPSLADRVEISSLVEAVGQPLSSALLLAGASLAWSPVELFLGGPDDVDEFETALAEVADELSRMPPILLALAGFVSGPTLIDGDLSADGEAGPSGGQLVISVLLPTQDLVEQAAITALSRLQTDSAPSTGQPFSSIFTGWTVRTEVDGPIMVLELDLFVNEAVWYNLIFRRDLSFLAW